MRRLLNWHRRQYDRRSIIPAYFATAGSLEAALWAISVHIRHTPAWRDWPKGEDIVTGEAHACETLDDGQCWQCAIRQRMEEGW